MATRLQAFFDSHAEDYAPLARYSLRAIRRCIEQLDKYLPTHHFLMVDVGAGSGLPSHIFLEHSPNATAVLIDLSLGMLRVARQRLSVVSSPRFFTHSDASALPLRTDSADIVLACCMLHLLPTPTRLFQEARRILRNGGVLCIIDYDRNDLRTQVWHRLFPGFAALDQARHYTRPELCGALAAERFEVLSALTIPYRISFRTRRTLIRFLASRPFSALSSYSNEDFASALASFAKRARRELPERHVVSACKLLLLVARPRRALNG